MSPNLDYGPVSRASDRLVQSSLRYSWYAMSTQYLISTVASMALPQNMEVQRFVLVFPMIYTDILAILGHPQF